MFLVCAALMVGCASPRDIPVPVDLPTATPTSLPSPGDPTVTPPTASLWVQSGVPASISGAVANTLGSAGFVQATDPSTASVRVTLDPAADASLTATWVYALVAPFATIPDGVSWADFGAYWRGEQSTLSGFDAPPAVILTADAADLLTTMLGAPGPSLALTLVPPEQSDQLADLAWSARPSISVVPFDSLDPRWKVLAIDGASPLDRTLDVAAYPLTVTVSLTADGPFEAQAVGLLTQNDAWQSTNRDPSRITNVVMTGVTALSRAVAKQMELHGADFPAEKILPFFADADILHTSNEASFTPECPPQDWFGDPVFCSPPANIALLTDIGVDIVELTGNHNNDYGSAANAYSLDMYDARGIVYFGGGRNLDDAVAPRILTAPDGTRIAFIGCNSAGPYKAWATAQTAGAAPCDDWSRIRGQIADLKASDQADDVIVTVQYQELDSYSPNNQQVIDFEGLAASGADIVSGSSGASAAGLRVYRRCDDPLWRRQHLLRSDGLRRESSDVRR